MARDECCEVVEPVGALDARGEEASEGGDDRGEEAEDEGVQLDGQQGELPDAEHGRDRPRQRVGCLRVRWLGVGVAWGWESRVELFG